MLRLGVKHYKMVFNYMEKYYSQLNWGVSPARRPPRLGPTWTRKSNRNQMYITVFTTLRYNEAPDEDRGAERPAADLLKMKA